jgi:lysophospholipase L1-like esterase
MKIACKKYRDVYYIKPDAALHNGESSTADGTHPNDNGYSLWEASIEKPILKILRKYGIRRTW